MIDVDIMTYCVSAKVLASQAMGEVYYKVSPCNERERLQALEI